MEVRGSGGAGRGAFVVAAKELHASIVAGSQVKHQLQSGAGPLSLEVLEMFQASAGCKAVGWFCIVVSGQVKHPPSPIP